MCEPGGSRDNRAHQPALWAAQHPPLLPRCSSLSLMALQCIVSGSLRTEPSLPGQLASGQAHGVPPALPASASSGPAQPDWSLPQLGRAVGGRARTEQPHTYPPLPPATFSGRPPCAQDTTGKTKQQRRRHQSTARPVLLHHRHNGQAMQGSDPQVARSNPRPNERQLLPSWEEQISLGSPREKPQAG